MLVPFIHRLFPPHEDFKIKGNYILGVQAYTETILYFNPDLCEMCMVGFFIWSSSANSMCHSCHLQG